jgi:LmeA-like phospholipid-binding
MTEQKVTFGEKVVNKFIEMILYRMINVKKLQVRVKANWQKLVKGELDGLTIEMYGFLLRKSLRITEFCFNIGESAVNLDKIKQRKIELLHPSEGSLRMVINQEQLSTYFQSKLVNLLDTQSDKIKVNEVNVLLQNNELAVNLQWIDGGENLLGNCLTTAKIKNNINGVMIEKWHSSGKEPPREIINIMSEEISDILSLNDVNNQGTTFAIEQIDIESGEITLQAKSYIEQFPTS